MINQMIIGTINQQWKHLMKDTAVPKVSCVVGNRPMRERRSSTNQIAGICRATTSHLLLWVPGSAKSAKSFLTQSPNFYELMLLTFWVLLLSLADTKVLKSSDKWQFSKQSLWDLAHQMNFSLAVQNSSIGLIVRPSLGPTKLLQSDSSQHYRVILETCDLWDIWSEW